MPERRCSREGRRFSPRATHDLRPIPHQAARQVAGPFLPAWAPGVSAIHMAVVLSVACACWMAHLTKRSCLQQEPEPSSARLLPHPHRSRPLTQRSCAASSNPPGSVWPTPTTATLLSASPVSGRSLTRLRRSTSRCFRRHAELNGPRGLDSSIDLVPLVQFLRRNASIALCAPPRFSVPPKPLRSTPSEPVPGIAHPP